jgi:general secretion pathway protein N
MIRRATGLAFAVAILAFGQGWTLAATGPTGVDPFEGRLSQPIVDPGAEPVRPASPVARENAPIGNPLWAVPLQSLSVTRERPIFSPSRRPPPPAVVAAPYVSPVIQPSRPPEPDHPLLTLVGTAAGTTEGFGIFIDDTTRDVVRLRTGEGHAGWILQSVRGREVTFGKDRITATLSLPASATEPAARPMSADAAGPSGSWMDGDGQLITPPPGKSPQPVVAQPPAPAPPAATPIGDDAWMGPQIAGPGAQAAQP